MSARNSLLSSLANAFRPAPRPIDKLLAPLQTFARHRLAGAGLLMLATATAIVWANSPWAHSYHALLHLEVGFRLGHTSLIKTTHHWINDGLMGVFFFMVGLEIKREVIVGELSTLRRASLPAIAAVGGMLLPAACYVLINQGLPSANGWGIPMATDIAFALGVLALLGDKVPLGLRVFLTALAIVDDIGAVVVIAVFYTDQISTIALLVGLAAVGLSIVFNMLGVRHVLAYLAVGIVAWLGFLESGVHATIAAILISFTIPARTRIDGESLVSQVDILLARLKKRGVPQDNQMNSNAQQHLLDRMARSIDLASAPLQKIEHMLSGPVTFVILPVFALANAGVSLSGDVGAALSSPIVQGIAIGLVVGKTAGIAGAAFLAVKLRIADLPEGVGWLQVIGVGMLGGVGFTMALFVAGLAFPDAATLETAKLGILAASLVAGVGGFAFVWTGTKSRAPG